MLVRLGEGEVVKVLIVDNCDILHKNEYEAEAVVILYDWGHKVVTKQGDVQEFCTDLGKLLSQRDLSPEHLKTVRAWLQEHKGGEL